MNKDKSNQELGDKPLPRKANDNLFIPKQNSYANLFAGGIGKKLSDDTQYFCLYSNYKEIEEIENENKNENK